MRKNNKIYIGSRNQGYIYPEVMTKIISLLAEQEIHKESKYKPRKIGENYLLELEINDYTKEFINKLYKVSVLKLYKRTHTWEQIYKMTDHKSSLS